MSLDPRSKMEYESYFNPNEAFSLQTFDQRMNGHISDLIMLSCDINVLPHLHLLSSIVLSFPFPSPVFLSSFILFSFLI